MKFSKQWKKIILGLSFHAATALVSIGAGWVPEQALGQVSPLSRKSDPDQESGGKDLLLEDLRFSDPQLALCVDRWAKQDINLYRYASDVRELSCPRFGIRRLDGVDQLTELKAIDLSHNPVESYQPLYGLAKELGFLWIWGNILPCDAIPEIRQHLPQTWIGGLSIEKCTPRPSDDASNQRPVPPSGSPNPSDPSQPSSQDDAAPIPPPSPPTQPEAPREPTLPTPPSLPLPPPPGGAPSGNENLSGKEVYLKECAVCHGKEGEGNERGYPIRFPVESYAEVVTRLGRSGNSAFAIPMPGYSKDQISDLQLREMWTYLRSFPRPQTGKQLFETYCANCHGSDGRGGFSRKDIIRETDDYREAIREGEHLMDYLNRKKYMPAYSPLEISAAEINLLRRYALELRKMPPNAPIPGQSPHDEDDEYEDDEDEEEEDCDD